MNSVAMEWVTLTNTRCVVCGVAFAVPDFFLRNRQETGEGFYCPNGHELSYKETEAQRLRRQLDSTRARERATRDQLDASERSRAALKGVVTRTKKRVGNGVCPCCNRTFSNVARHMATQHPEYAEESA